MEYITKNKQTKKIYLEQERDILKRLGLYFNNWSDLPSIYTNIMSKQSFWIQVINCLFSDHPLRAGREGGFSCLLTLSGNTYAHQCKVFAKVWQDCPLNHFSLGKCPQQVWAGKQIFPSKVRTLLSRQVPLLNGW